MQILLLVLANALVYQLGLVVHQQLIWQPRMHTNVLCQDGLLVYQSTLWVKKHCVWRYKQENSIFAVKKPRQIFVQLKYYWPIWRHFTQFIMVKMAYKALPVI